MSILEETDQRFVGIEKKIGLFIIIAVVGILTLISFIQRDLFVSKTRIFFVAESGQGISEGMAVRLSGFKIGKVKNLALDDIARVKVELSIFTKYMKWIRTNSRARLIKEGLIGDSIIEITPGALNSKEIPANGAIDFEREKGLSGMAEELKDVIIPVLQDAKKITQYFNDPHGEIKQTLSNVAALSKGVLATKQDLDSLIKNTDRGASGSIKKLDSVLDSTKKAVDNVNLVVEKLDREIPPIVEKVGKSMERLDKSLENVQKTTEEIKKATEKAAPAIPSIIEKGGDVADGTKDVVDAVKKTWPIRTFIKNPEEKKIKTDSYE